ncbi:MAG TPA: amidohydrolase family protein [Vicinamibacterales bacterium]|nr:amidohydrolase family protein [Vicinamibacterales bacterium]
MLFKRGREPVNRGTAVARVLLLILLASVAACTPRLTGSASGGADVVFRDVTIVDVENGGLIPGQTVLISGNRITGVSPARRTAIPPGAQVVDSRGKYLIPGLWDMHVHLTDGGSASLPLFVAHGVTGVRDMGGDWDLISGWRDLIDAREAVGPRMRIAGPIVEDARWLEAVRSIPEGRSFLDGSPRIGMAMAAEAQPTVDSLVRLGVDFIKVRNAPPREAYFALVEEARRRGLPVVGHLPGGESGLVAAIEAGQMSIEHIGGLADALDGQPENDRRALYARIAERGIAYVPTLVAEMRRVYAAEVVSAIVADSLGLLDLRRRYISDPLLAFWRLQEALDKYDAPRDWEPILARALGYLQEMQATGVPMLAGTDFGSRLVYPGWSLHDELMLLVEYAGLSPLQALQTATRNAAWFFGEADEFGTVEPGKRADLVLLSGDPLVDIRNTQRIEAVVLDGRLYPRASLDEFIAEARNVLRPE